MSNKVIGDYMAASGIDGSTNFLLIQPGNSSTAYNKINRNVLLGVTGQPMDISTSQNVSNKTLDNTNILTVRDDRFTIQDSGDTTKQAQFQLSGLTTAITRTYTLPDRSSTIATLDGNQTFTGTNSFTGSAWSGGTIDNSTVTVDSISGHTVAGNGIVYGLSIHSGIIQTVGAGTSTLLVQNAVQGNQLATNAITIGYAQITSTQSITSSFSTITGLSVTVTVPAGGRRIKITVFGKFSSNSISQGQLSIIEGSTQMGYGQTFVGNTTSDFINNTVTSFIPSAGSHTYFVECACSAGTALFGGANNVSIGTLSPAFILVEMI